jgi:hypothetical protein
VPPRGATTFGVAPDLRRHPFIASTAAPSDAVGGQDRHPRLFAVSFTVLAMLGAAEASSDFFGRRGSKSLGLPSAGILRFKGGLRESSERLVHLEMTVGRRAARVHHALRNALMIEVSDLLPKDATGSSSQP